MGPCSPCTTDVDLRHSDDVAPIRKTFNSLGKLSLTAFVLAYLAAKLDFFRRFDPNNFAGYFDRHWCYWAVMLVLGCLASLFLWLGSAKWRGATDDPS